MDKKNPFLWQTKIPPKQWKVNTPRKQKITAGRWFAKEQERASISISLGKLIATVGIGWMAGVGMKAT